MAEKAKDAFRTITEVAEWLDTPTHVLRFWESKFSQIKPVKGAGGRRYYRPTDMDLLGGIKKLLHEDGMTIKGTQKLLRDKGVRYVASLGPSMTAPEEQSAEVARPTPAPATEPAESIAPPASAPESAPSPAPAAAERPVPPAAAPAPVRPRPEQTIMPFDDPVPAFTLPPPLPEGLPDVPGRLLGRAPRNPATLTPHAARILPLLDRLSAIRARMTG